MMRDRMHEPQARDEAPKSTGLFPKVEHPLQPDWVQEQSEAVTSELPRMSRLRTSFVGVPVQRKESDRARPNRTGLPDRLKAGVENLSGYSLDDVRVHYNSPKPAHLQAHAYTQGTSIHVAPGQEKHLPHETWHAVQQMQGRVKPTMRLQDVQVNDDRGLEREADIMGERASILSQSGQSSRVLQARIDAASGGGDGTVQRLIVPIGDLVPLSASLEEISGANIIKQSTERLKNVTNEKVNHLDSSGKKKPLATLGRTEALTIVAHGGHLSDTETQVILTYGGHTPEALAALLIANGLKPEYGGTIYLNGCNTGTSRHRMPSYASCFQRELRKKHGISVVVKGNSGATRVLENGQTGFKKETLESKSRENDIKLEQAGLKDTMRSLERIQHGIKVPWEILKDTDALVELGLDKGASEKDVVEVLEKLAVEKLEKAKNLKNRLELSIHGIDKDELFEERPKSIVTLPRPKTDNEILAKMVGLMVLVTAIAAKTPSPLNFIIFMMGVIIAIGMAVREMP